MSTLSGQLPLNASAAVPSDSTAERLLNPKHAVNGDLTVFLKSLDGYSPTLPIEVVSYYLSKAGVNISDQRVAKLVSLATDKFMADIIFDAKQFSLLRQQSHRKDLKRKAQECADTLQFQDLAQSAKMRGISISRPHGAIPGETAA